MALEVMRLLPEWLTEDYIADILRKGRKSDLQIKIRDVTSASGPGDNYLGSVYRITLECNSLHKSLILKVEPSENEGNECISSLGVFQREIELYYKVLPNIYTVMKEKLGNFEYFSPYCYPSARSDTVILEDLRPLGYKMADRKEQLDLEHALKVLTILAKLHAFSYIMSNENIKHYYDIWYSRENRHLTGGLLASVVNSLSQAVSTWKGFEKYASSIRRFSETALDQLNEAVSAREGTFCVLNHGDCWTNNLLFRYCPETGEVIDVKLIDFQLGRYCSPALDLLYFFYSSLRLDVWRQQDQLLKHYHSELIRWLSSAGIGASVYTFQDLQKDMKEKLSFALATVTTVAAIAVANPEDAPDLEKLFYEDSDTETSQLHKAHCTGKYREKVQVFLPYFEKAGLLHTE